MAGDKLKGVKLQGSTYWVRVAVPKDVGHMFDKGELWENLKTSNPHDAAKMAPPIIAGFKKLIADARAGRPSIDNDLKMAREALRRWAAEAYPMQAFDQFTRYPDQPPGPGRRRPPILAFQREAGDTSVLEQSVSGRQEWDAGLDRYVAALISHGDGKTFQPAEPVVHAMRREVGVEMLRMIRRRDRIELSMQSEAITEAAKAHEGDAGPVDPLPMPKALPAPSLTLRKLFDEWRATRPVNDKEKGRLEHQIRRLTEFVGDKPANHLTKDEIQEFMSFVARFPGRKRSAALSALPMRELVEKFEADNAAIAKRNAAKNPGEPHDEIPGTLKAATVDEWFAAFKRMFAFGVWEDFLVSNPFEGETKKHVAKGAPAQKKRQFTPEEITKIFTAPLFNGFDGDGLRG